MSISTFDKPTLRALSEEIRRALDPIAKAHGLEVQVFGGAFDDGMYRPRVEFHTSTAARDTWTRYAPMLDLPADAYERTITIGTHNRQTYTLIGISLSSRRFPVLARREDGLEFKLPVAAVRAALEGK